MAKTSSSSLQEGFAEKELHIRHKRQLWRRQNRIALFLSGLYHGIWSDVLVNVDLVFYSVNFRKPVSMACLGPIFTEMTPPP